MRNKLFGLWNRLNAWIDGLEPESHAREHEVHKARSTEELEKEYLELHARRSGVVSYRNRSMLERFREWENTSGAIFFNWFYKIMSVVICGVLIAILLLTVSFLPPFGDPANPANNEVFVKYITESLHDTNATNVVAGIILDYRAFDTFGEATVLFIASCAVMILLRDDEKKRNGHSFSALSGELREPRQDTIMTTTATLAIPMVILYGVYVILGGHIGPGGGFSGGTILGSGLILYLCAFGSQKAGRILNARVYMRVTASALSFYALVKGYSFFSGANHLETWIPHGEPGAILSGGLILPLNIAVGLVVAFTMYGFYALFSKGEI